MGVREDESVNYQFSDTSAKRSRSDAKPNINLVRSVNPFLSSLEIKAIRKEGIGYKDSGDVGKITYLVERDVKTVLFASKDNRERVLGLSAGSLRLLFWIVYTIESNQDVYWLNRPKYMRDANVSLNTVKTALGELQSCKIILPTEIKDVYFIDPSLFFSGSRLKCFEENVVVNDSNVTLEKKDDSGSGFAVMTSGATNEQFRDAINNVF